MRQWNLIPLLIVSFVAEGASQPEKPVPEPTQAQVATYDPIADRCVYRAGAGAKEAAAQIQRERVVLGDQCRPFDFSKNGTYVTVYCVAIDGMRRAYPFMDSLEVCELVLPILKADHYGYGNNNRRSAPKAFVFGKLKGIQIGDPFSKHEASIRKGKVCPLDEQSEDRIDSSGLAIFHCKPKRSKRFNLAAIYVVQSYIAGVKFEGDPMNYRDAFEFYRDNFGPSIFATSRFNVQAMAKGKQGEEKSAFDEGKLRAVVTLFREENEFGSELHILDLTRTDSTWKNFVETTSGVPYVPVRRPQR